MANNLYDLLFSPLGREWCMYYLVMQFFFFASFLLTLFYAALSVSRAKTFTVAGFWKNSVLPVTSTFFMYLVTRLMYSICVGALH